MRRLVTLNWGRVGDIAIGPGLLALGLAEVSSGPFLGWHIQGPRWATALLFVVIGLPQLWRRSRPALAFSISMLGIAFHEIVFYPTGTNGPGEVWFWFLLVTFSLAHYARGRPLLLATVSGSVAFAGMNAASLIAGTRAFDVFTAWIFPGLAWVTGYALQRRTRSAERLSREAVVSERARIARELHDVITHDVSVIVMRASVERRLLGKADESVAETLREIERSGRDALGELRVLLDVLRDPGDDEAALTPIPGLGQLEALVHRVSTAGLPVALRVEGDAYPLPPGIELAAYRTVQEGLTNVLKHAGAARAEVLLRYGPGRVELEVEDDGRGPGGNGSGSGSGLTGLRERAELYGGRLETCAAPGGGFALRLMIPVTDESWR